MPSKKRALTFRLSVEAVGLLRKLSQEHGVAQSAVVEASVRHMARWGLPPLGGPYGPAEALPGDAPRPRKRKEK
jgi:hypothetical protein